MGITPIGRQAYSTASEAIANEAMGDYYARQMLSNGVNTNTANQLNPNNNFAYALPQTPMFDSNGNPTANGSRTSDNRGYGTPQEYLASHPVLAAFCNGGDYRNLNCNYDPEGSISGNSIRELLSVYLMNPTTVNQGETLPYQLLSYFTLLLKDPITNVSINGQKSCLNQTGAGFYDAAGGFMCNFARGGQENDIYDHVLKISEIINQELKLIMTDMENNAKSMNLTSEELKKNSFFVNTKMMLENFGVAIGMMNELKKTVKDPKKDLINFAKTLVQNTNTTLASALYGGGQQGQGQGQQRTA